MSLHDRAFLCSQPIKQRMFGPNRLLRSQDMNQGIPHTGM
jgi:hypothetical protein